MKKNYINAVCELLLQGKDVAAVLQQLQAVLVRKNHQSIHAQILQGVLVKLESQRKTTGATVIVAKETDVTSLAKAIEQSLQKLGTTLQDATIVSDSTLIGGYIALSDGQIIDASYKQKLVSLYRQITK